MRHLTSVIRRNFARKTHWREKSNVGLLVGPWPGGDAREAAMGACAKAAGVSAMAKATTKLSAQDRIILFCAGTGIDHAAIGILAQAMQSMAVRGFIGHDRDSGAYALTDSGRATLSGILEDAGLT